MVEYLRANAANQTEAYAKYLLAYHCAPTLIKVKPAVLVNVNKRNVRNIQYFFYLIKKLIKSFGCGYYVLFEDNTRCLIFIYNQERMKQVFYDHENLEILQYYGYQPVKSKIKKQDNNLPEKNWDWEMHILDRLKQRYSKYVKDKKEFPHEIGVLLGYPPDDVVDFIRYHGQKYLMNGFWKVYHNKEQAQRTFEQYFSIRSAAIRLLEEGSELKKLKSFVIEQDNT